MKTRIILFLLCLCTLSAAGQVTRPKCPVCGKLKVQCPYKGNHPVLPVEKKCATCGKPLSKCPGHEAKCLSCGKVISKCPYNGKHPSKPSINATNNTTSNVTNNAISNVSSGYENGHGYVDLGLSVKWATCNVGASSPTDYGSYFAWGETRTKSTYDWDTYFDVKSSNSLQDHLFDSDDNHHHLGAQDEESIYSLQDSYDFYKYATYQKTILDLSDDAAHVNWGGSWRMPTRAEQDELREKCTWTWTTQNGVKGYKVSSKLNSNSIFLPAAGDCGVGSLRIVGSHGYYWSSSLNVYSPSYAYNLYLGSDYVSCTIECRSCGLSVRAVCP